ncbi:acyltransferase [Flavobacterium plurextorum]|uniref:acyltransferase n=1 Tax=Flavobacterium plurextorum TaxID=1114867 RepID=UPI003756AC79
MSSVKKIYLSYFGYIISFFLACLAIFGKPFMVYGYYNKGTKKYKLKIRISNTAKLINRKLIEISDDVWIWHHSIIDGSGGVIIEEGVQIGAWVGIFTHSSHNAIRLNGKKYFELSINERKGYEIASVKIGEYSFIGSSSIILPGVTLGKNCIVAVGSVVKKSFPDYSIISGNPAKLIGNTKDLDSFLMRDMSESIK